MTDTYTAGEFLKRLTEGALRTPLVCEGFAKPAEGSYEAFIFSLGTSCESWIKIPIEIVEKVEFLGEGSCRDHSHPFIQIHFKEPSVNEPSAVVFASLLRASDPEPIHTLMLPIKPFMGEWLARVIADAAWFADGHRGGGEHSPADVFERKMCLELRQRCRRGDQKACRLLAEEC